MGKKKKSFQTYTTENVVAIEKKMEKIDQNAAKPKRSHRSQVNPRVEPSIEKYDGATGSNSNMNNERNFPKNTGAQIDHSIPDVCSDLPNSSEFMPQNILQVASAEMASDTHDKEVDQQFEYDHQGGGTTPWSSNKTLKQSCNESVDEKSTYIDKSNDSRNPSNIKSHQNRDIRTERRLNDQSYSKPPFPNPRYDNTRLEQNTASKRTSFYGNSRNLKSDNSSRSYYNDDRPKWGDSKHLPRKNPSKSEWKKRASDNQGWDNKQNNFPANKPDGETSWDSNHDDQQKWDGKKEDCPTNKPEAETSWDLNQNDDHQNWNDIADNSPTNKQTISEWKSVETSWDHTPDFNDSGNHTFAESSVEKDNFDLRDVSKATEEISKLDQSYIGEEKFSRSGYIPDEKKFSNNHDKQTGYNRRSYPTEKNLYSSYDKQKDYNRKSDSYQTYKSFNTTNYDKPKGYNRKSDFYQSDRDYDKQKRSTRSDQKGENNYSKFSTSVNNDKQEKRYSDYGRPYLSEHFDDPEYQSFRKEKGEFKENISDKIKVIEKDLFQMSEEYSLGHCVAEDMRMGSGIAVNFKKQFKSLATLLSQNQKQGGLAELKIDTKVGTRYIYYLVTKEMSHGKPTYESFWMSLKKMRDHIREHEVKKLAIPRIGCGLDRLEWNIVKHMIDFLFRDVDVEIVVCDLKQDEDSTPQKDNTCKVVFDEGPVSQIAPETTIIYFCDETGQVDEDVKTLNEKFNFREHFQKSPKQLGYPIKYDKVKNYILYGCVVRKTKESRFDFESFAKCLNQIKKNNLKDGYYYVAYQTITDNHDPSINEKIITLLRNLLRNVDVYVCTNNKTVSNVDE